MTDPMSSADWQLAGRLLTHQADKAEWARTWGRRLLDEINRLRVVTDRAERSAAYWQRWDEEWHTDEYHALVERTAQLKRAHERIRELEGWGK